MWETGLQQDWDSVMEKLSGRWKAHLKDFAFSESGDHVALGSDKLKQQYRDVGSKTGRTEL